MTTDNSLKILFCDFYEGMEIENGFIWNILEKKYTLTLCEKKPDLIIYGPYGKKHKRYRCPKIFWTHEAVEPDYTQCFFSFSFCKNSEKNMQISNIVTYENFTELLDGSYTKKLFDLRKSPKNKLFNFIYRNNGPQERINFCTELQKKTQVDCLGTVLRNINNITPKNSSEDWKYEKLTILKDYHFTIAFENQRKNGYITEKIFHPFLVNSIPIYWGAPDIKEYFNPDAFISVDDFHSFQDCIEYVLTVKDSTELTNKYRDAAPILPSSKLYHMSLENIESCLISQVSKISTNSPKDNRFLSGIGARNFVE